MFGEGRLIMVDDDVRLVRKLHHCPAIVVNNQPSLLLHFGQPKKKSSRQRTLWTFDVSKRERKPI